MLEAKGARITDDVLARRLRRGSVPSEVCLYRTSVTDEGVALLRGIPSLRSVSIVGGVVSDQGVGVLGTIDTVQKVELRELPGVSDDGVEALVRAAAIDSLSLIDLQITDRSCGAIARLSSLGLLNLSGTNVTDNGLVRLSGLENLWCLRLDETMVEGWGVPPIRGDGGALG